MASQKYKVYKKRITNMNEKSNISTELGKIKLVVFDFDGTLAIHTNTVKYHQLKASNKFYETAFVRPDDFYFSVDKCVPNTSLLNVVSYCRLYDIPMYCLSAMKMSLHLKAKETFVHRMFGEDITMLMACSSEEKVNAIRALCNVHGVNISECLFFDDLPESRIPVSLAGGNAFHPDDVDKLLVEGQKFSEIVDN